MPFVNTETTPKKRVETDKTMPAAAFDLEEVLLSSKTNEGGMYYPRQLNSYFLSVYGKNDKTGYNFFWNETTAKRGFNEIASCVMI